MANHENSCNLKNIEHIRSAWFALNTYVLDNKGRDRGLQSFSYRDLGHFVYDVGQMVHVFEDSDCYEVTKFLVELKSYSIGDAAIGEEITAMIQKNPNIAINVAEMYLHDPISPCFNWYVTSSDQLANKPDFYCISQDAWVELLRDIKYKTPDPAKNK